jgi:hypothetical protein
MIYSTAVSRMDGRELREFGETNWITISIHIRFDCGFDSDSSIEVERILQENSATMLHSLAWPTWECFELVNNDEGSNYGTKGRKDEG